MSASWGPLQPLCEFLLKEDQVPEGEKDRRQSDAALAKMLAAEDFVSALQAASLEQLDVALAHDALAVERKPLSFLTLLSTKASKLEAWQHRKNVAVDEKAAQRVASARLVTQLSQLLYQLPVSVATKELKRVSQLAAQYVALAVELRQAIKAVFPLKSFLRRLHTHGNAVVTGVHASFFYLCLQAKCYAAASDILSQPLFEVHPQLTAVDFLGYAYYGGVLLVGQKKFQEANEFFLAAVTAPALALSAFVVEAYKKLVLSSLILNGQAPSLPKYTPFAVSRHLEAHCGPYNELSRAFTVERDLEKLATVAQNHSQVFVNDGNFGLVKQVIEALKQRKLLQLPQTYVTIALSEVAKAAGVDAGGDVAVEKLLLQLIAGGEMAAVIDQQKRMVKFVLDAEDEKEDQELEQMLVMEKLQSEMEKVLFVSAQLRAMDTDIVTSAKFQHRSQKEKDRRSRGTQSGGDDRMLMGPPGFEAME